MFALFALLATTPAPPPVAGPTAVVPKSAVVRLSLNDGGDYRPGDRVDVKVTTASDGYLLVFRVDGDGYIRVLFPLDPGLDPFVRGGHSYALRGRGDHASFLADDLGGTGLILAVLSSEPYNGYDYATGGHWDYGRLRLADPAGDAEAQLLAIIRRMTDNGRFSYDVVGYRVWGPGYENAQPTVIADGGGYLDSCLACGWRSPGFSISIGSRWYDPWYSPFTDPWYGYGRGYNGWRYNRWNYSGWNGWWGWDPYWGTPWRPITIINTPRRPVVPNPIYGTRARVPQGGLGALPGGGVGRGFSGTATRPTRIPGEESRARRRNEPAVRPPSSGRVTAPSNRGSVERPAPSRGTAPVNPGRARSRRPNNGSGTPASSPVSRVEPSRSGSGASPVETRSRQAERRPEARPVYLPPVRSEPPQALPAPVRETQRRTPRTTSSPPPTRRAERPRAEPIRSAPVRRAVPTSRPTSRAVPSRSAPTRRATPAPRPASRAVPSRSVPTRRATPAPRPTSRSIPSVGRSAPSRGAPSRAPTRSRSRGPA